MRVAASCLPFAVNIFTGFMFRRSNAFYGPSIVDVTGLKISELSRVTSFRATVERSASGIWELRTTVLPGVRLRAALVRVEACRATRSSPPRGLAGTSKPRVQLTTDDGLRQRRQRKDNITVEIQK